MPTLALSTGSLHSYGLNRAWDFAAEAGFDAVEVMIDSRWDTRQADYLRERREQTSLPVVALHTPFRPIAGFGDDYPACVRQTLALASEVGARTVVAHPELSNGTDYGRWLIKHDAELSLPGGPRLAVENLPLARVNGKPKYRTYTLAGIARFPCITLDTTHFATAGIDPLAAYETLWERVGHLHLSDFAAGQEHQLPGSGTLPLDRLLVAMVAHGYDGVVTVELVPEAVAAGDDREVRTRLRAAADFCRRHLGPG